MSAAEDRCREVLIGGDPSIVRLRRDIVRAARMDLPVLIVGETGVGKELIARLLHELSDRPGELVCVNMAALPTELAEAELFGTSAGAFTGARERTGVIHAARNGTLYLDEACSTPDKVQAKLLRTLDSGRVRRVGAVQEECIPFRLVTSSQRDPDQHAPDHPWRADFMYRVTGLVLRVTPLRERTADIALLASSFMNEAAVSISSGAMDKLVGYHWPGNVRQLRQVLARAHAEAESSLITASDVARLLHGYGEQRSCAAGSSLSSVALKAAILRHARSVLAAHGNHVATAARALGVSRATLYRWLRSEPHRFQHSEQGPDT